jgi:hypothetical protein
MWKEMQVIPVNKGGRQEKNNWKKWRVVEEESHKRLLTQKKGILEFIFGCHPADSMPLSDMT